MILVIGGAFQGKERFAKEVLGVTNEILDGNTCLYDDIFKCTCIRDFHLFVKRFGHLNEIAELASMLILKNPDIVIISNEIGYGVVPVDPADRKWREQTGRICCELMQKTERAYRVMCGTGIQIKGAQL